MQLRLLSILAMAFLLAIPSRGTAADDILVADFESTTYGEWKVEGDAFGTGPAQGTLPNQMDVSGYLGRRLVSSFHRGDTSKGVLTSPAFKVERPHLNFLIGGGGYQGETCLNLLVEGRVVRSATGPNTQSGGHETLAWQSWDVREFSGAMAQIQIVDKRAGGWGHINVDHILQSETPRQPEPALVEWILDAHYLLFPVKNGAPKTKMLLLVEGQKIGQFDIELATDEPVDFYAFTDVRPWRGKKITIDGGRIVGGKKALSKIVQSDELDKPESVYRETFRPQFHFTSKVGWLNDPNGLVYDQGQWHLFYQHNPYGWSWGNMHWGHATSHDLFHWNELGDVLRPWVDTQGACFSGSAVVDHNNSSGFGAAGKPPLVVALTDTGAGESIAYSTNRGKTWSLYQGNPVVKHNGRDPKIIWHPPTQRWVMAVYDETDNKRWISFYASKDLKAWDFQSRIEGFFECPDLFELAIDGSASETRWVLYAADARYVLGNFDGSKFTPLHEGKHQLWHGNFYAAQTFSDAPNGRRVQIGWGQGIEFPKMPFNQQMCVPVDLTLRQTDRGPRLFAEPVPELNSLRTNSWERAGFALNNQSLPLPGLKPGDLLDIELTFKPGSMGIVGLGLDSRTIEYDAAKHALTAPLEVPLPPIQDQIELRILADRGSIEIFGNDGRVAISKGRLSSPENKTFELYTRHANATIERLRVHQLKSVWH